MFEPTVLFQGYFYVQNLETFEQMRSFVEFQIPVTFLWKGFQGSFQKFLLIGVLHDCFMKYKLCYMGPYRMFSFLYDCSRILPYECGLHSSKYCTYKCSWSPTVGSSRRSMRMKPRSKKSNKVVPIIIQVLFYFYSEYG